MSRGEPLKQVFNAFTGKPDWITRIDSNTVTGTGTCTSTSNSNGTVSFTCVGGGGGSSSLQVTQSGVQVTSPTASINLFSSDFVSNAIGGTTAQIALNPNTTDFIQNNPASAQVATATVTGLINTNNYFEVRGNPFLTDGGATQSVIVGAQVAAQNTASSNSCLGYNVCHAFTSGANNSIFGHQAGPGITSGAHNTCMGHFACNAVTGASHNTGVGSNALGGASLTGNDNIAIGYLSGDAITSGFTNTVISGNGVNNLTTGSFNDIISDGGGITTGVANTIVGNGSSVVANSITTGSSNTIMGGGDTGGADNVDNQGMTYLGYNADAGVSSRLVEGTAIGFGAQVKSSFTIQMGGTGTNTQTVNGSTLTFSSATVTNLNLTTLQGVTPGLVAGTNITSITGTWPNQTINATTQGGGGASSLAVASGTASGSTIFSSPTVTVLVDSNTIIGSLVTSATAFLQLNPSSVTLQGNTLSISAMNTALSTKVNYSSFSATLPITYNSATGVIGATQISLSTGAMNILPTTLMVSTVAYITSTQTFSGNNTFISSSGVTVTYSVVAGSGNFTNPLNSPTTALLVINNDTVGTEDAAVIQNGGQQNALQIIQTANVSKSFINGGSVNIVNGTDPTNPTGHGAFMVAYTSDTAPVDNMFNFRQDATLFSSNVVYVSGLSQQPLVSINFSGIEPDGKTGGALNVTSSNPNYSAVSISGQEGAPDGFGTVKISHTAPAVNDANASALSIDLLGTGTAAQGIFLKSSAGNGTTGKLVNIRNPNIERFVILSSGSVDISPSTGVPYALFISTTPGQTLDNATIWISTNAEFVVNGSTGTSGQVLSSQGPGQPVKWINQSAGGGGGGIIYPATFTWVNNFGIYGSTFTMVNSTVPTTLSVSTSATGVSQLAVSSTVAVNPTDPILSISSTSGTTILWIDNAGNLISSGTTTTVTSCGTSPSVAGNNIAGQITVGGGVVTSCTLNFANGGFVNAPICVPSDNSATVAVSNGATSATSAVFNLSATLGGGLINYVCVGYQR